MGKVLSTIIKPLRDFNIESRAHKAISRTKHLPAPKYEADKIAYDKLQSENPDLFKDNLKRNEELDARLRSVFVTSLDDNPIIQKETPERPLPANRMPVPFFEFGYKEPDEKSRIAGRVSLKEALTFITNHQSSPADCSVKFISDKYLISEEAVADILYYFKVYEIYIPSLKPNKYATFAGPSFPRTKIDVKKLTPSKIIEDELKRPAENVKKS